MLAQGERDRFCAVSDVELAEDGEQVKLDASLGEPKFVGDVGVGETAREGTEDFKLTRRERWRFRLLFERLLDF